MKNTKHIPNLMSLILWVLTILMLVACEKEESMYSSALPPDMSSSAFGGNSGNNGEIDTRTASFATILKPQNSTDENGVSHPAEMEDDKMGIVYLQNPQVLVDCDAHHEGQRILYNNVEMTTDKKDTVNTVHINYMIKILTKTLDFPKAGEEDLYGRDGIHLIGGTQSRQHLTFQFQIRTAGGSHRFSLLAKEGIQPDKEGYLTLMLRHHNESGTGTSLSSPSYVSFLITDAPGYADGTLKGFRIEYIDLNNQTQILNIHPK